MRVILHVDIECDSDAFVDACDIEVIRIVGSLRKPLLDTLDSNSNNAFRSVILVDTNGNRVGHAEIQKLS